MIRITKWAHVVSTRYICAMYNFLMLSPDLCFRLFRSQDGGSYMTCDGQLCLSVLLFCDQICDFLYLNVTEL